MWKFLTFTLTTWTVINKMEILAAPQNYQKKFINDLNTDFVFPTWTKEEEQLLFGNTTCTNKYGYCENVESYPTEKVNQVLVRSADFINKYFGVDDIPSEPVNRGGEKGEILLCQSRPQVIFPKVVKNKNQKWKYVINTEKYVQGVKVEICAQPEKPCDPYYVNAPYGYITKCVQKYTYRKLISLRSDGTPMPDTFELPSACCCVIQKDPKQFEFYQFSFG